MVHFARCVICCWGLLFSVKSNLYKPDTAAPSTITQGKLQNDFVLKWCIQNHRWEHDQFWPIHCPYKLYDLAVVTYFLVTEGQANPCSQRLWVIGLYIPGYMLPYGYIWASQQKKREYTGWVIPHRLLWQLEHLRCKQIALHGGGDALFGNRGTGQPVVAETLRVDDDLSHNV